MQCTVERNVHGYLQRCFQVGPIDVPDYVPVRDQSFVLVVVIQRERGNEKKEETEETEEKEENKTCLDYEFNDRWTVGRGTPNMLSSASVSTNQMFFYHVRASRRQFDHWHHGPVDGF